MTIVFFKTREAYGCFSNFSRHEVQIYGYTWPTSEHAYQAMKFNPHRPDLFDLILNAKTPKEAAELGRKQSPIRTDWELPVGTVLSEFLNRKGTPDDVIVRPNTEALFTKFKDVIMYQVVRAKVLQNKDVQETLLNTEGEPIIEGSPTDAYWGWGPGEIGQNKLGRTLMLVRSELRC